MIEFWVGVDGGGTHTRARIRDRAGKLLGEGRAAGSNLELGIPFAHGNVLTAIASARQAAGLDQECEQQMGVGLALASAELADCYHAMLAMPVPFASVRLTSDAFGACLGAFGGEEGAILIAGTGSAGLIYRDGRLHTCSGRGFPISDLGSGAWLGLRAIQQSLLCHDGILPPSALAVRLMDHFRRDQAEVVRWAARALPADYEEAEREFRTLRGKVQISPQILANMLRNRKTTLFLVALAELAEVDFHTARKILERREMDALAVICKAADFDRSLFLTFALLILDQSDEVMMRAKAYGELYANLPRDSALRTIRFWRLRRQTGDVAAA